jgi:hypothetical protein
VSEAQGGQRRYAAHYHCIMHRKRADFGAQLPRCWRTADQSRRQSSHDPRNARKNTPRTATGKRTQGCAKKTHKTQKNDKNSCRPQKNDFFRGISKNHLSVEGWAETRHENFEIWDLTVEKFGIWIVTQLGSSADSNSNSSSGLVAKVLDAAPPARFFPCSCCAVSAHCFVFSSASQGLSWLGATLLVSLLHSYENV